MDVVGGSRAYLNTGLKNESSTFLKATWEMGRRAALGRRAGPTRPLRVPGRRALGSVSWTFFNPQGRGPLRPLDDWLGLYASLGRMTREPARSDMLNGEDNASLPYDLRAVQPERLLDVEAGIEVRRGGLDLTRQRLRHGVPRARSRSAASSRRSGCPSAATPGRSHRRGVELDLDMVPHQAGASRGRPASAATGSRSGRSTTTSTTPTATGWTAGRSSTATFHRCSPPRSCSTAAVDWSRTATWT